MGKKKILFVNGHLNIGGIEKTLVDLLNHIDYSKYDVDLLLLEGGGGFINMLPKKLNIILFDNKGAYGPFLKVFGENLLKGNYKLIFYRLIILFASICGKKYLSLLRVTLPIRNRYDIAIAYRPGLCADVVAFTIVSLKRYVWWHNGEFNLTDKQKKDTLETWNKFDCIVAVSEGCKQLLKKEFPSLSVKLSVLYNILNIRKIEDDAAEKIENDLSSKINIISVGRLSFIKHFENAIIVAKKLVDSGITNFHWIVVGDGPERSNLQKMIADNNVSSYIELVGAKANPYPYIKNSDLMVHTSYGEAHCTAILEAMALKVPCLVTKTYIPQDFTIDGINCYLVEQNVDSLYNGLVHMMNNLENLDGIVDSAYEWVCKRYAPEKIVADFYRLIE